MAASQGESGGSGGDIGALRSRSAPRASFHSGELDRDAAASAVRMLMDRALHKVGDAAAAAVAAAAAD
jgi:hypothetical protein